MLAALLLSAAALAGPDASTYEASGRAFIDATCPAGEANVAAGTCWSSTVRGASSVHTATGLGSLPDALRDVPAGLRRCGLTNDARYGFQLVASDDTFPWRVSFTDAPESARSCAHDLVSSLPLEPLFDRGEVLILSFRAAAGSPVSRPLRETHDGWCHREEPGAPLTWETVLGYSDPLNVVLSGIAKLTGQWASGTHASNGGMSQQSAALIAEAAACEGAGVELAEATWRFEEGVFREVEWMPATPCAAAAEGPGREAVEAYLRDIGFLSDDEPAGSSVTCTVMVPLAW